MLTSTTAYIYISGDDSVNMGTYSEMQKLVEGKWYWEAVDYQLKDPDMPIKRIPSEVDFCSHYFRKVRIQNNLEYMPTRSAARIMATIMMDLSAGNPTDVEERKSLLKGALLCTRVCYYTIPWVRKFTEAGLSQLLDTEAKADWRNREYIHIQATCQPALQVISLICVRATSLRQLTTLTTIQETATCCGARSAVRRSVTGICC